MKFHYFYFLNDLTYSFLTIFQLSNPLLFTQTTNSRSAYHKTNLNLIKYICVKVPAHKCQLFGVSVKPCHFPIDLWCMTSNAASLISVPRGQTHRRKKYVRKSQFCHMLCMCVFVNSSDWNWFSCIVAVNCVQRRKSRCQQVVMVKAI